MDKSYEYKRTRQACLNCRRKKTRCSGEMPVCSFCARLNQRCSWDIPRDRLPSAASASTETSESALTARVALLESKLSLLGHERPYNFSEPMRTEPFSSPPGSDFTKLHGDDTLENSRAPAPFSTLPDRPILQSLLDTYFNQCHNQPYAYFHEATFRRRFEEDALPAYLLFAFAATACRFTDKAEYQGRQAEAIKAYAEASWAQICDHCFSYEKDLEVGVVQATNMLVVIDFTAGHPRLGWVKVALSVRLAQALHLNEEPDHQIPVWEQEERRRTFWSIYLLDQLISIGPNRPPTFSDADCTVHLPCHEDMFTSETIHAHLPTLEAAIDEPATMYYRKLDDFALTIIMASALGRLIRFSLKGHTTHKDVPWDFRSGYYRTHSMLLHFESHSPCTHATLDDVLQKQFKIGGAINRQNVGHLILSQALFHLNHCLLNHPFILHRLFQRYSAPTPPSFVKEATARCQEHAARLLDLIQNAQQYGRLAESSFYGYCAMTSGIIFRLYEHHLDTLVAQESRERVKIAIAYLERIPVRWEYQPHMAAILRTFQPELDMAASFIYPARLSQKTSTKSPPLQLLDYAWLQSASQWGSSITSTTEGSPPTVTDDDPLAPTENVDMRSSDMPGHPLPELHAYTGLRDNDLQAYLGDDMGGIWAEVFSGQKLFDGS